MNQINSTEKLRVVSRRDLPIGTQALQSGHAAIDFQHEHPEIAREWQKKSNYLAFLTVSDESQLINLISKAILTGIKYTVFREPDIDNQITAVAFEPSDAARRLTSSCPLLGKEIQHA